MTVIVIFLVFAPAIILYSMGWRYDFAARSVVHTGVVSVSTQPERATVFIDGTKMTSKTPTVIKNVLPGRHRIELQRDNYFSWYKSLNVEASRATLLNDVVLLRSDRSYDNLLAAGVASLAWSHKQAGLIYTYQSGDVWFVDTAKKLDDNGTGRSLLRVSPGLAPQVIWSPDDQRALLLPPDGTAWLLDVNKTELEELKDLGIKAARWQDDDEMVYQDGDGLLSIYDVDNHTRQVISSEPVIDFYSDGKSVFVLRSDDNGQVLLSQLLSGTEKRINDFAAGDDYGFVGIFSGIIVLMDRGKALYFLEQNNSVWILDELRADVQDAVWLDSQKKIFFWNRFELSLYSYVDQRSSTLLRSSSEIHEVVWHPTGNMFFLAIDDRLEARELDERDRVNSFTLWDSKISQISLDREAQLMFFVDSADGRLKRLQISD